MSDELPARLRAGGSVYADEEAAILRSAAAETGEDLYDLLARRLAGEPVETIAGWVMFRGRRLHVAPGVFVPRRRTEWLVEIARASLVDDEPPPSSAVLVELCCGVAPVAASVAAEVSDVEVHATDLDEAACSLARRNLSETPLGGSVHRGDLFAGLPSELRGRVDVLAANAPYVPSSDVGLLPREAKEYEPRSALDGGPDGIDLHRRIVAEAPDWLAPAGTLLIETTSEQADLLAPDSIAAGLAGSVLLDDETYGCVLALTGAGRA